jgi:hypothetical protein
MSEAASGNEQRGDKHNRREALRLMLRASYAAPAVTTVLLSSCQPTGPSGGMGFGPSGLVSSCQSGDAKACQMIDDML